MVEISNAEYEIITSLFIISFTFSAYVALFYLGRWIDSIFKKRKK